MRNDDPFAELIRSLEENLERESRANPPPPARPPQPVAQNQGGGGRAWLWIVLPLLVLILFGRLIGFYADLLWYDSLALQSVFLTRIWAQFALFAIGAVAAFAFLAANVLVARRLEPFGLTNTGLEQFAFALNIRPMSIILAAGAVFALLMGINVSGYWEEALLYLNQIPLGLADPLFQRDVSFFLFTLPVWSELRTWLLVLGFVTLLASGLVAGLGVRGWTATRAVLLHLALLAGGLLLLFAWGYRLNAYALVYSTRGAVFGAGYADVHAQLPVYNLLSIVTLAAAVILVATVFVRRGGWRAIVAVIGVWAVLAVLAGNVYPGLVQRFQVSPNELNLEREYIGANIAFTRAAYDLDDVQIVAYDASQPLTAAALQSAPETVRNTRLWDYRPLLQTYNQIQALTQYYEFNDVDIDRYVIDGELRQVMIAARELAFERLNPDAQTWVNRRLVYTHGYGVAASPVAEVARDGLPTFLLKDLPPQGAIPLEQPQIYFGERTNDYVIVRTDQPEFDYSRNEQIITTTFGADTGIEMSLGARLLFAIHFADLNLLLNSDIHAESQLLWRRNITERIQLIAPFLEYDRDPYLVIGEDGQIYWFVDAYTYSNRFPYSTPVSGGVNYIRNSVKIVTNAYDGAMRFYVVDDQEPIIAAYQQIFPALFTPISEMPMELQRHIRYPNDLFTIQAEIYRTYHMTNPNEFYNKEDVWAWPEEIFENQTVRMEPYYVLLELPGSDELHFMQILPFTPANRENMIAWLATQNDPERYGEKIVFEFGKDTLYYGPKQVEARIDQDPIISQQLTLWNQQGSSVIRGNLIVIPIGDSLLYVEPIYLQAASGRIPELKRVVLATAEQVIMAENLGLALAALVGRDVLVEAGLSELAAVDGEIPSASEIEAGTGVSSELLTLEALIQQANTQFNDAQARLREGNWAGYGTEITALQQTLTQLSEITAEDEADVAAPTATP